jgi:Ca-activated chloride channel family protein
MPRSRSRVLAPFLALFLALLITVPAQADGIIIPDPPICRPGPCPEPIPITQLAIEYHRVSVQIENQVAITKVDQVFRNDQDWEIEGTYIFPLPVDAAVTSFTLWIDGLPVEGKILTREEARRTYEEIVRNLLDPALLEYVDRGAVQASVFPIPPGGKRRIQLEYSQVLTAESGLFHYVYPLSTEKYSTEPLEEVSISVTVDSQQPLRAVYSPSHKIAVNKDDDYHFSAGYEAYDILPNQDFELYYSVDPEQIGLNLLTYRDPKSEDGDGFFLLLAAPGVEVGDEGPLAKDVLFVLDQSGSMDGEKFRQAQQAMRYVLEHLNPDDRFNAIAFSTGTRHFASALQTVDAVAAAKRWVDSLSAQGSTDINRALLEAVAQADPERPTILIFLTDGLPTEGVTDSDEIIRNLAAEAGANIRLFAFGVGYDVDTFLLDTLAQEHHGAPSYVTPGQALDEAISAFYAKVSNPVLMDIGLDFGDVVVYDLQPDPLPDLFAGSQLALVGRYRHPGTTTIRLEGMVGSRRQTFTYREQVFRSSGGPDFLPRLWATRKIGALLNQIRLEGPQEELVDQVVKLSIRYGIVTPYTSYLVTEPDVLGAEAQEGLIDKAFQEILSLPMMTFGQDAVERAMGESSISGAEVPAAPSGEQIDLVQIVGSRTFRLVDGVWTDTAFDPKTMQTVRVPFLSEEYFLLAASSSDLAGAFALGTHVIAMQGEQAYEVVGADQPGDPISIESLDSETSDDADGSTASPSSSRPPSGERSGLSTLCPSALFPLALVAAPLSALLRRRPHSS